MTVSPPVARGSTLDRVARDFTYRHLGEVETERILTAARPIRYDHRVPVVGLPLEACEGVVLPRFIGGAGFASYSDIIAALTTNAHSQRLLYAKASFTTVANQPYSYWAAGGLPGAGAFGTALTGRTRANGDAGSLVYTNPTSPRTMHLISGGIGALANLGTAILYDRLVEYPFSGAVTAAQNFNGGTGVAPPARDAAGAALGAGVLMFLENLQATTAATGPTLTVTYTNSAGTGSQSTGAISLTGAAPVNRVVYNNTTSQFPWYTLAAGDTGVRSVQAYNLSATLTSTQLNLVLARPLAFLPNLSGNDYIERDFVVQLPSLIRLYDNSYLAFLLMANVTSSAMHGSLTIAEN